MFLQFLSKHNRLPDFARNTELDDETDIVAPRYRDVELLPKWYQAFQDAQTAYASTCKSIAVTPWVSVSFNINCYKFRIALAIAKLFYIALLQRYTSTQIVHHRFTLKV